jgi:prepilin-type processing-associated H-X9-DG protein
MGRNKYIVNFQNAVRTYRYVPASKIRHSAQTILVTEYNADWHVVNDVSDADGTTVVCKSHRPVCPYIAATGIAPGAYKLDLVGYNPMQKGLIRVHVDDMTPYPHINNPAMGNTGTSLDWVGRNHGSFKLGSISNHRGNGVISGWDMRTTNFLYCDGHVENKNIVDTIQPAWEWGDEMYSLNQGTDINTN